MGPCVVGRAGFEPATFCTSSIQSILRDFREFQLVDLRRSEKTAYEKVYYMRKFFEQVTKPVDMVNASDIREYLKGLNGSSATYKNVLGALKVFFRDFIGRSQVVASFKFPRQTFKPKHILTKKQLQRFYNSLGSVKEKTLFLLYATSGLRRSEVLSLTPVEIDLSNRMITPGGHEGETKKSWLSFYNAEAEKVLKEYLASKKPSRSERFFPMPRVEEKHLWKVAKEKTELNVTPQRLREWFCSEMLPLGVQETYVVAFCGRVPKSVLARHYTDFSSEKLKEIYDKAGLTVLT